MSNSKMTNTQKIAALEQHIAHLEAQLADARRPRDRQSTKKYDVLNLLKEGPHSTSELAEKMNTTKNNIGSLLTYLRKQDGIILHMDHNRRHYIAG